MKRHSKAKQFNYILKLQCDTKMSSAVMLSWIKPTAPVCSQQQHSPLHSAGQLLHNTNQTKCHDLRASFWVLYLSQVHWEAQETKEILAVTESDWSFVLTWLPWRCLFAGKLPLQGWNCGCWSGGGCAKLPVLLCICLVQKEHPEGDNLHPELHRIMKYPLPILTVPLQPGGEKVLGRSPWSLKEGYKKEGKSLFTLIDGDSTRETLVLN